MPIFAYDDGSSEPCAYNTSIDQMAPAVSPPNGSRKVRRKRQVVAITGVPGTSVDTRAPRRPRRYSPITPEINIVGGGQRHVVPGVARSEMSKILATHPWDLIDGLWTQAAASPPSRCMPGSWHSRQTS